MTTEETKYSWECNKCKSVIHTKTYSPPRNCLCGGKEFIILASNVNQEELRNKLGECYGQIIELINNYMDLKDEHAKIAALWIIGTYFHERFNTFPYLFINAMRGSGKTRLLKIIAHLSKGGFGQVQTGITEAVLFRMPKGQTLCLDEAESLSGKDKAFLREYLNACYKKGGIVKRTKKVKDKDGESFALETFEPYKPIALANIWGLEEVLGDRCVTIVLEKSDNSIKTKKQEDFEDNEIMQSIKRTLDQISVVMQCSYHEKDIKKLWNEYVNMTYSINYTTTYITLTTQNYNTTFEEKRKETEKKLQDYELDEFFQKIDTTNINGRNLELFFPLLQIARGLSIETFEEMIKICKIIVDLKKEDEFTDSKDVEVYDFVSSLKEDVGFLMVKDLVYQFKIFTGESEDWINDKWLGRALKRLNLIIAKKRMASGIFVILDSKKAKEKLKIFKKGDSHEPIAAK
jgi:hypothetical protein